jgi:XTP/dITP diphosphohydrolase
VTAPVVLATRSSGKLRELVPLFARAGWAVQSLEDLGLVPLPDEDRIEVFETFEENAIAKARYFHERVGLPVVADDSGLVVAALGGAPGVHSRRWSGMVGASADAQDAANNVKLLASLRGVADRRARYVCAAAFVDAGRESVATGETAGVIVDDARGVQGFGYDPLFLSDELGMTFGEAGRDAKEAVSHRGRAFRTLLAQLVAR